MQATPAILAILLATVCSIGHATPKEVAPPDFSAAAQQFGAGAKGDAKARDGAVDAFRALAASHPGHPLFGVYEGAATALQGRDALMPWDKMKLAEKGANLIEKSLAQLTPEHDEALIQGSPESILARLVAANTLLALPSMMNRHSAGKRAVEAALASPAFASAPAPVRAALEKLAADLKAGK